MEMTDISNRYRDLKEGKGYINISLLKDYIIELFTNGHIVAVCDFLQVTSKKTQPYMEYSLYKENGYILKDLLEEISKLKKSIKKSKMKTSEIFFEVGVLPKK